MLNGNSSYNFLEYKKSLHRNFALRGTENGYLSIIYSSFIFDLWHRSSLQYWARTWRNPLTFTPRIALFDGRDDQSDVTMSPLRWHSNALPKSDQTFGSVWSGHLYCPLETSGDERGRKELILTIWIDNHLGHQLEIL